MHTTLVSPAELAPHLDGSWAIVDCRYDLQDEAWGRAEYLRGHVPGAVYAGLTPDLAWPAAAGGGRHPLPSADRMAALFGHLGIDRTTQVVAYDQGSWLFASRCWWMLRYMGHTAVAVLDGGWARWVRERRPVQAEVTHRTPAHFEGRPVPGMVATIDEVASAVTDRRRLLVDARSPERFAGRVEPIDRAAGHIPGAVNHHHQRNAAPDGTMLPPERLREQLEGVLGNRPPADVVMYCGSGVSACHNLLAMAHAGLPGGQLYPGSWSEWSADPARPVETGDPPTPPARG